MYLSLQLEDFAQNLYVNYCIIYKHIPYGFELDTLSWVLRSISLIFSSTPKNQINLWSTMTNSAEYCEEFHQIMGKEMKVDLRFGIITVHFWGILWALQLRITWACGQMLWRNKSARTNCAKNLSVDKITGVLAWILWNSLSEKSQ